MTKTIPKKKKCRKGKYLPEEALQIAEEKREVKSKKGRERNTGAVRAEGGGGDAQTPEAALYVVLRTRGASEHPLDTKGFLNSTKMANDIRKC